VGLSLVYQTWGDGPLDLVLLHGFTGNRTEWDCLRPALAASVRAIAVDLPGHGESQLPKARGEQGFLETLDALGKLLDDLHVARADLAGYSQGARIGLAFAVRFGSRIRKLVLEGGSPGLNGQRQRLARQREDAALAERILGGGLEAFVREWEKRPLLAGLRRLPAESLRQLQARRLSCAAEGLAGALNCLGLGAQPNDWPRLPRMRAPTLLVTGARDPKFTRIARQMAAQLPLAWVRVLDGSGHAPHLETPDAYARELLAFLETPWFEARWLQKSSMESRT
jgi:2-succinyl-6-hydroxy-2,4-cyclohexadiene-1-carboxylate synthase